MVWARTRGQKITLAEIKKMVHGWIEEDVGQQRGGEHDTQTEQEVP